MAVSSWRELPAKPRRPLPIPRLTAEEVGRALEYSLFEINQFPAWMAEFGDVHLKQFDGFLAETVSRWSASALARSHAQHVVQRYSQVYRRPVPESLAQAVWRATKANAWASSYDLSKALGLVSKCPALSAQVASEARARTHLGWGEGDRDTFIEWFCAWMQTDAMAATAWLEENALREEGASLVEGLASHWLDQATGLLDLQGLGDEQRCAVFARLYLLLREVIRPTEDEARYGVHSASGRDNAARMRDTLPGRIASIGGLPAYRTFERICRAVALPETEARWLHQLAYGVAEQAVKAPAWTVDAFLTFSKSRSFPMQDEQSTFVVVRGDVDEVIRNLQEGEFSIREMLRRCNEKDMQLWVARELELLSRGRYRLVREPEQADNTAPDVVARSILDHKVTLELKLADQRTVDSLMSDLRRQLLDDYLKAQNSNFGMFVVMWKEEKTLRKVGGGRMTVEEVRLALEHEAEGLMEQMRRAKHLAVRCFVCPPAMSPRNQEKARERTRRKERKTEKAPAPGVG